MHRHGMMVDVSDQSDLTDFLAARSAFHHQIFHPPLVASVRFRTVIRCSLDCL
jgi:hypothetical protein